MTPRELVEVTRAHLRAAADPVFAAGVRNFFQEAVDPHGVRTPQVQAIMRLVYRELKAWPKAQRDQYIDQLWKSGKLEEGALVCHVYRRFSKECGAAEFKMFEKWIDRYVKNWSHCDGVSSWLVSASIANHPELIDELTVWTKSRNRWKRRAAAVSLLQEAKRGENTDSILRICEMLRNDPDVMVQKGVGWVVKEAYPRRPSEVLEFLADWRTTAPRLILRYAAEKMTPQHRKWLMNRTREQTSQKQ
jgi:3-methyladenine DNA glycosylase AlkD